jgi:polysaccharide export outer membrane protein
MRVLSFTPLLLLLLCGCASRPQHVAIPGPSLRSGDYLLVIGDRLLVVFTRGDQTGEIVQIIDPSGSISLPLVGKLHVAGMTSRQARQRIKTAYQAACWLPPLEVSISKFTR